MRKWELGLDLRKDLLKSILVWIGFHLWYQEAIGRITSMVGTPLFMDVRASKRVKCVCVKDCVDIRGELLDEILIQMDDIFEMLPAEYEWKPPSCSYCSAGVH